MKNISLRTTLIALVIFYFIILTFVSSFKSENIQLLPSYLSNALSFNNVNYAVNTASSSISSASGILGIANYLKGIAFVLYSVFLFVVDIIFIVIAVISLIGYYPYLLYTILPSPLNSIIASLTIAIILIEIVTEIKILSSGIGS